MIKSLSVKNQSIETSGITKDYKEAICEYVWNGFEANATEVRISHSVNSLGSWDSITISDNGDGIDYNDLNETFGAFLASRKNLLSLNIKSKSNKGKGRFSFIAFSSLAVWDTVYEDNGEIKKYSITLRDANKEDYEFDEPHTIDNSEHTGTVVTLCNVSNLSLDDISYDSLEDYVLSQFSWYLYLNQHNSKKIYIDDVEVDFNKYINLKFTETVQQIINGHTFEITLIVWNEKIKEKFRSYFLNANHSVKGYDTTNYNRNTVDFSHSIFVESSFFDKWNDTISFEDYSAQIFLFNNDEDQETLKKLKKEIQNLIEKKISEYMSSKADEEVNKMISQRRTFPIFSDDPYGDLRKNDLINVTKQLYSLEPRIFYRLTSVQEKSLLAFLNLILSSEERHNVLTVIEQLVQLTSAQRKQLADILEKTHLENVIDTINFVEKRYQVIEILKTIVYDFSKFANERDHIQRIIEQNYWLFGEEYNLVSADLTMQKSLEKYTYLLYGAKKATDKLSDDLEADRRMDIFMCGSKNVNVSLNNFIQENIVVELKAPKIILSKDILRQIEDYMDIIRNEPQFNSQTRRWKFIAVCKKADAYIKELYDEYANKGCPRLVRSVKNCEIYAYTWDDVFKIFDLRHSFILDKLKYNRDQLLNNISVEHPDKDRSAVDYLTELAVSNQ